MSVADEIRGGSVCFMANPSQSVIYYMFIAYVVFLYIVF